jgi:hypothetical protein
MSRPEGYMTLREFFLQELGYVPDAEELTDFEQYLQAYCAEKGVVWFKGDQPVMPPRPEGEAP